MRQRVGYNLEVEEYSLPCVRPSASLGKPHCQIFC
jgi:hypothetical protein